MLESLFIFSLFCSLFGRSIYKYIYITFIFTKELNAKKGNLLTWCYCDG